VEKALAERDVAIQYILVDDGSSDETLQLLYKYWGGQAHAEIIKLTRNFGGWPACRAGMQFIKGDCFMYLAADLQDPPELIVQMVDHWLKGCRYVLCERATRDDPWSTKLFASIYYKLVRLLVARDFPPVGYDVALMDRAMLPHLLNCGKCMNIALLSYWLGFDQVRITYDREKRVQGVSGWTMRKKIRFFIDSLLGFSVLPLRVLSLTGVLVSGISASYGIYIVLYALLGEVAIQGFATVVSLICFLLGLIILMLGVIGEYLWRIFDEINKRPEFVIEEVHRGEKEGTECAG
jgi:dolichol-phosphate mannosyltransferase